MMTVSPWAAAPLALAAAGFLLIVIQLASVARHLRRPPARPEHCPGISILKPLCGLDDDLWGNLESFARLDYPAYEVLLGVRSPADTAWPIARAAAARWPHLCRVVIQRGEPGQNPKVNQLITLEAAARHPIVVVSDSNVRVAPGYLREIAALLCRPDVGMVTSPVAGAGEARLGSRLDNLHLTAWVATGMIAAARVAGRAVVVGKSMALWRRDLARLGGFESARDVLGEDWVLGRRVGRELGKRVAVARLPVENLSRDRGVADFLARYRRWSVMHRQAVGSAVYCGELLLNPLPLLALSAALAPSRLTLAALLVALPVKVACEAAAGRLLRPGGFPLRTLLCVPLKDALLCAAWLHGLLTDEVDWRGTRLRVGPGTRLEPAADTRRFARLRTSFARRLAA